MSELTRTTYAPGWVTALLLFATPAVILGRARIEAAWRRQLDRHADWVALRRLDDARAALSRGPARLRPRDPSPVPRNRLTNTNERHAA